MIAALRSVAAAGTIAVAALVSGCDSDEHAGATKTETRDVAAFDRVEVDARTKVTVRRGDTQELTLRGGEELLEVVTTTVANRTLTIDRSDSDGARLAVTIVVPRLAGLDSNSSESIEIADLDAGRLELRNEGVGEVSASGRVDELSATVTGTGSVHLAHLIAERAAVRVSGVGDAKVNVTGELDVAVTGLGSVEYHGNPMVRSRDTGLGGVGPAE